MCVYFSVLAPPFLSDHGLFVCFLRLHCTDLDHQLEDSIFEIPMPQTKPENDNIK